MLARFNVFPSAILSRRFKKILYSHRVCDLEDIENIEHFTPAL